MIFDQQNYTPWDDCLSAKPLYMALKPVNSQKKTPANRICFLNKALSKAQKSEGKKTSPKGRGLKQKNIRFLTQYEENFRNSKTNWNKNRSELKLSMLNIKLESSTVLRERITTDLLQEEKRKKNNYRDFRESSNNNKLRNVINMIFKSNHYKPFTFNKYPNGICRRIQ